MALGSGKQMELNRTLLHPPIVFFQKNRNLHYTLKKANLIRITQVGIICRSRQMYEDMPCFFPTIQQQIWLHYQSTGNYYLLFIKRKKLGHILPFYITDIAPLASVWHRISPRSMAPSGPKAKTSSPICMIRPVTIAPSEPR